MNRWLSRGLVAAAVLCVLALLAPTLWAQPALSRFFVHYIDVGQADGILITNTAKTCNILIDAGDTRYPESSRRFREYLTSELAPGSEIALAIATHPHNDHIGSMQWVLENYRVRTYIDNGQPYTSQIYARLMTVVREQRQDQLSYFPWSAVPATLAQACGPDGPVLDVLHPANGIDTDVCADNPNNCSVITKLTLGPHRFLFPGDAEEEQEQLLLADSALREKLDVDVLKVPHHGSDTSSSAAFLNAVTPSWMVVSAGHKGVGTNAGYKHPRFPTLRELLTFAGGRTARRLVDAYDPTARTWRRMTIWGGLYVTARDGTVVLAAEDSGIRRQ